jgi:hypothetical protein
MPTGLIDSEALTEAARELCELATALNPGAEPEELLNLAAAALSTLAGDRAPDPWLEASLQRAGQQLRWIPWDVD